jgi:glycosyltransferase involved in cell wall biosynthesis
MSSESRVTVRHLGPDPATVGGMASVIRMLTEHRIGADIVDFCPTWTPRSRLLTAQMTMSAARTLRKMPAAYIVHVHLSERGSFLREGALAAFARSRGLVTVVTIHGASFVPFARRHPNLVTRVIGCAHAVTCLDQAALETLRRCAPQTHSEILPNPVEPDDDPLSADETDELVLFAGEIGKRKGADVLERAWRLVAQRRPHARCLMVGPPGDYVPVASERLEVRDAVDPAEIKSMLRRARVIALPSRAEGIPMILTEASGLGRPFVSTPVGGIPDLARAGGFLVPVGDATALAERLADLLEKPDLARAIGEQGRRACVEARSIEVIGARLRALYSGATLERDRSATVRDGQRPD